MTPFSTFEWLELSYRWHKGTNKYTYVLERLTMVCNYKAKLKLIQTLILMCFGYSRLIMCVGVGVPCWIWSEKIPGFVPFGGSIWPNPNPTSLSSSANCIWVTYNATWWHNLMNPTNWVIRDEIDGAYTVLSTKIKFLSLLSLVILLSRLSTQ